MVKSNELLGSVTAWLKRAVRPKKKKISQAKINVHNFARLDTSFYLPEGHAAECRPMPSCLCTFGQLDSPTFRQWANAIGERWRAHRKLWELAYICETLSERGMLSSGKRGLGFAVGLERLPSLFAARGCEIVATDLPADDDRNKAWANTGQWAPGLGALNQFGLCPNEQFHRNVTFRAVDMNDIPRDLQGFDFTWSTCSFEHCGSLELGLRFLENQMTCLVPGGVAVHTTEFNLSSNDETVSEGSYVIYRLRDIEEVFCRLRDKGFGVQPLLLSVGEHEIDRYVDGPPYSGDRHLRLDLQGFAATSIGLIISKPR